LKTTQVRITCRDELQRSPLKLLPETCSSTVIRRSSTLNRWKSHRIQAPRQTSIILLKLSLANQAF